jgi:hypothetical protein
LFYVCREREGGGDLSLVLKWERNVEVVEMENGMVYIRELTRLLNDFSDRTVLDLMKIGF